VSTLSGGHHEEYSAVLDQLTPSVNDAFLLTRPSAHPRRDVASTALRDDLPPRHSCVVRSGGRLDPFPWSAQLTTASSVKAATTRSFVLHGRLRSNCS